MMKISKFVADFVDLAVLGIMVDRFGRKRSIILNALIFIFGAILLSAAPTFELLVCMQFCVPLVNARSQDKNFFYSYTCLTCMFKFKRYLAEFNQITATFAFVAYHFRYNSLLH